jgi:L-glyceraldehyde 3-phosphate reductase
VILGALTAIGPLSIDMYLPALPRLTRDLSTGAAQAQLTLTACLAGLAVGQVVAGPLSDALGRRRPLLAGVAIYVLASLLCVLAPTVEALIALRLVQGAAGAAGIVIARAVVRDLYDGPAAARFFTLLMLVNGLAPILAPVAGGQLLRVTPWPGIFGVIAAIGTALFLAALVGLRETLPLGRRATGGARATGAIFRRLLTDRSFVGYALSGGLAFAAMFTYISGSPFVLQDIYGLSPQAYSLVFGANALGLVATGQLCGHLTTRVPLRRLLRTGLTVVALGGVTVLIAVSAGFGLGGVLPGLFLVVAGQGLILPTATALALSGRPAHVAGSASALLGLTQFAIGGAASPLAGLAGPHSSLPMAAGIAALSVAALLVAVTTTRPRAGVQAATETLAGMTYVAAHDRYDRVPYRRSGRSGLQLPAVSLGLWHNFGDDRDLDTQRAILRRAFDLGITHFDLANNYGPEYGSAEVNFGRLFREDFAPYRDELVLSTKAGYDMWPGPYGQWGSRKYLLASLDQSLKRMGVDYVDIFYSHRFDPETPLEETMGALDHAVRSGKALYAGISSYSPEDTARAAAILREMGTPLLIHQPSYSMLNRWIEGGLLDTLEQEGVGCIAFSPLAQGMLTDKYLNGIPEGSRAGQGKSLSPDLLTDETLEHVRALNDIAAARGQSLAQMALAWALRDQRVTSVLIGASSVAQLEDSLASVDRPEFTSEELKRIDKDAVEAGINLWAASSDPAARA